MITNADLDWLEIHYPGMIYIPASNILRGCLWFRMVYFPADGICEISPKSIVDSVSGIFIEDAYELDVEFDDTQSWAIVKETAERIKWSAGKWGKVLADIHVYSDGSLCVCPKPEERLRFPNGFNIRDFFNNLLIPNLFYQSYFEKYGKEPWKGSSHGELGILESYNKFITDKERLDYVVNCYIEGLSPSLIKMITIDRKIDQNLSCLCGLNRRFQNCHVSAFVGLQKLHKDYWLVKSGKFRAGGK